MGLPRAVMCSNGIRYDNADVAAKDVGLVDGSHILAVCRGTRKAAKGLTFWYDEPPPEPQSEEETKRKKSIHRKEHPEVGIRAKRKYLAKPEARLVANESQKRRNRENPDKVKNRSLRTNYGISLSEAIKILESQGGLCAICKKIPIANGRKRYGWSVDHCHKTKKIRGILCQNCNLLLGQAKDAVAILQSAIEYLKKTP